MTRKKINHIIKNEEEWEKGRQDRAYELLKLKITRNGEMYESEKLQLC